MADTIVLDPPAAAEDGELRGLLRSGAAVALLLAAALAGWTALAPLAGAVTAPGVVGVDKQRQPVQHSEGGIVREVLVQNGDQVQAGQLLLRLHDVPADAAQAQLRSQADAELARQARLRAERQRAAALQFAPELLQRQDDGEVAELMQRERALFALRRGALDNQLALLARQTAETEREIVMRSAQSSADDEAFRLQTEEAAAQQRLVSEGFISLTRLRSVQRETAESDARRGNNRAELARAQQRVSELKLRALALHDDFQQQAERDLRDSTAKLFELQQRLRPLQDAADRLRIVAPVSGVVVDLQATRAGVALAPRERLLDIVPADAALVIDTQVRPQDIAHVQPDAAADVRLSAFAQRLSPTVRGRVSYVSADRLLGSGGEPYYAVQVQVAAAELQRAGLRLQPGMPAEVHLLTAPRTPLWLLLDPLFGHLGRALREP